jgi:hypothetical protein
MKRIWVGEGVNYLNAKKFYVEECFTFGGRTIPAGVTVSQF